MWAAQSRGFPVDPVMTQDEARRRLRAILDTLPEDERRRFGALERHTADAEDSADAVTRH